MARVGFKTAAVKEEEARELENGNSPLEGQPQMGMPPVVAETFERLEALNDFVVSEQFAKLDANSKQTVLNDLLYVSQVANIL